MGWSIKKPAAAPKEETVAPKVVLKKPEVQEVTQETKVQERIQVVREIPMSRKENPDGSITFIPTKVIKEDGMDVHLVTVEEALTIILNGDLE